MKNAYRSPLIITLALLAGTLTSGCASNAMKSDVAIKTDLTKRQGTKKASNTGQEKFSYLSKITLTAEACPERDSKSYGLLMQSKTVRKGKTLTCYYN